MRQMIGATAATNVTVSSTTAAAMAGVAVAGLAAVFKAPLWAAIAAGAAGALLTKVGIDNAAGTGA